MAKQTESTANVPATAAAKKNTMPVATQEDLQEFSFMDANALDVVRENLGAQQISPSDFERIKFPTGGGQFWEVTGLSGDTEMVKSIQGLILMHRTERSYWSKEFSGEGAPPDCRSRDLITGIGTPGGLCATCPFSQWGSAAKGDGQACKVHGTLFVLQPGELLPIIIPVPVASVTTFKKFMLNLSSKNVKYSHVVFSLELEPMVNKGNIKYARLKPRALTILPDVAKKQIDEYIKAFRSQMEAVQLNQQEVDS
jgi:hypothetical protein